MAVRDGRGDVRQTTTGFRGPLMVQSLTSAKSKFLSLQVLYLEYLIQDFYIKNRENNIFLCQDMKACLIKSANYL